MRPCGISPGPAHADYAAWVRSGGHNDPRGGGPYSGRLTDLWWRQALW